MCARAFQHQRARSSPRIAGVRSLDSDAVQQPLKTGLGLNSGSNASKSCCGQVLSLGHERLLHWPFLEHKAFRLAFSSAISYTGMQSE